MSDSICIKYPLANRWKENCKVIWISFDQFISVSFIQTKWKVFRDCTTAWIQKDHYDLVFVNCPVLQVRTTAFFIQINIWFMLAHWQNWKRIWIMFISWRLQRLLVKWQTVFSFSMISSDEQIAFLNLLRLQQKR